MDQWLRCDVAPGQFSQEYAVSGRQFDGEWFSLFAPKELVECDAAPSPDRSVKGWIGVRVAGKKANLILVRLPRATLENGQFVTVNADQLKPTVTDRISP